MSKPRYPWWGYAKNMIRNYPALSEKYKNLHEQSLTADYSGMPKGVSASRGVEDISIRELPPTQQREYESVRLAILQTERYLNGSDRLYVIRLVFWDRSHTLGGAAQKVPCHYKTAQKWHNEFIKQVAKNFGLMDKETPQEPK